MQTFGRFALLRPALEGQISQKTELISLHFRFAQGGQQCPQSKSSLYPPQS